MRWLWVAALALIGCIEDRVAVEEPGDPVDGAALDARAKDAGPLADRGARIDQGVRDGGPSRDAAPIIDAGPPPNCDQPDPGSCEAAGCAWSEFAGCALPRACRLAEAACRASEACVWGPYPNTGAIGCRPADGSTCDGWARFDCRLIDACVVVQQACIPAVDAPCDQVPPVDCWRAPACVSERAAECSDQPKQQEPPREIDAGPQPDAEPEAGPECFGPGDCGDGAWCRDETCVSCDVPARCVDAP